MSRDLRAPETLSAYLDGELPVEEAARLEAAMRSDPELAGRIEDLRLLGATVKRVVEAEAADLPEARFEQIYSRIEREIARESVPEKPVGRWAFVRDVLLGGRARPVMVTAGFAVAGLALFLGIRRLRPSPAPVARAPVVRAPGDPAGSVARPDPPGPGVPLHSPASLNRVAVRESAPGDGGETSKPEKAPAPVPRNEADVVEVEFGGRVGRIEKIQGRRGTTTVIWVTEEEPADTERDL